MGVRASKEGMERCRNLYIYHGSISHLRGLVQVRTKENKGQKKKNLLVLDYFFFSSPNLFPALFLYFADDNEYRHVLYFDRCTRLS